MIALFGEDPVPSVQFAISTPWAAFFWIAVSLVLLPRILPGILRSEPRPHVGWNFVHVGWVAATMLAASIALGLVLRSGAHAILPLEDPGSVPAVRPAGLDLLFGSAAVDLVCVFVALGIAHRTGSGDLRAVGIRTGHEFSAPLRAIAAFALCIPGLLATASVWAWFLAHFGVTDFEQPIVSEIRNIAHDERLAAVVLGVFVIPLCEEILFRGFLQSLAVQMFGSAGGILSTSVLFALLHGTVAFLPILALSCLLGLVMVRTQRLHASCVLHSLFNGFQFLMLYAFPDFVAHHSAPGSVLWGVSTSSGWILGCAWSLR